MHPDDIINPEDDLAAVAAKIASNIRASDKLMAETAQLLVRIKEPLEGAKARPTTSALRNTGRQPAAPLNKHKRPPRVLDTLYRARLPPPKLKRETEP